MMKKGLLYFIVQKYVGTNISQSCYKCRISIVIKSAKMGIITVINPCSIQNTANTGYK